jgi:hypothetical protein
VVAITAVCIVTSSATASHEPRIGDASTQVAGFTAGELLGEELRQILGLPLDRNPAGTGDKCLWAGHRQKVLLLWTIREPDPPAFCRVKAGTPVFFYGYGGECSNVEAPPFFGATERAQRQCMIDFLNANPVEAILVSVDGRAPVDISGERYRAISPQGSVFLPDPNSLGVSGNRRATFVGVAYSAVVRPLAPGTHTITVTIVGGDFAGINRAIGRVVPGWGY